MEGKIESKKGTTRPMGWFNSQDSRENGGFVWYTCLDSANKLNSRPFF